MKVWITGSSGFLGSYLWEELSRLGHLINGNDNRICSSVDYGIKNDCRNFDVMRQSLWRFRPDILIHCAATAHEGLSNFSPSFITRNIYEASVSTFSAAISAGVKRIIFMSSMARYGESDNGEGSKLPFTENHFVNPIDPYGLAKVAAEKTLEALCKLHGVEYVIAVPHNIIGPRQKYDDPYRNVASIMINRALQDRPLIIYGDGQQKRCFSPIKDCLNSLIAMIEAPISGETINIGPDRGEITILKLASLIKKLTGLKSDIQYVEDRPNEVKEAWCSSDKARQLLGYKEQQPLMECLQEMVDFIKKNGTKPFQYNFPIEIENKCPSTWLKKRI